MFVESIFAPNTPTLTRRRGSVRYTPTQDFGVCNNRTMKSEPKPESRRSTYVSQRSLLQRDKTPRAPAYTIQSSKRVRRRGTNWSGSHFNPRQSKISAASATQIDKKELCSTDVDRSMACCRASGSVTEIGICCRCAMTCEARSTIISSPGGIKPAHCVDSGGSAQVHQSAVPAFAQ